MNQRWLRCRYRTTRPCSTIALRRTDANLRQFLSRPADRFTEPESGATVSLGRSDDFVRYAVGRFRPDPSAQSIYAAVEFFRPAAVGDADSVHDCVPSETEPCVCNRPRTRTTRLPAGRHPAAPTLATAGADDFGAMGRQGRLQRVAEQHRGARPEGAHAHGLLRLFEVPRYGN